MKRIRVADPAEQDLDDIWYYIAKNSGSIEIADGRFDHRGVPTLRPHS